MTVIVKTIEMVVRGNSFLLSLDEAETLKNDLIALTQKVATEDSLKAELSGIKTTVSTAIKTVTKEIDKEKLSTEAALAFADLEAIKSDAIVDPLPVDPLPVDPKLIK